MSSLEADLKSLKQFMRDNSPREIEEVREARFYLTEDDEIMAVVKTNMDLWKAVGSEKAEAVKKLQKLIKEWPDHGVQDL